MISLSASPTCETEDWLCREVRKVTGNDWLAAAADWLVAKPIAIGLIIVLGLLIRWVVNRLINRVVSRASGGVFPAGVLRSRATARSGEQQRQAALALDRRRQRAETMASVLRSIAAFVIFAIVAIMAIAELGYNIGPLIASAGLVGVALGFGAQSLVKDFLAGIFMFFEDQYGVGDQVLIGETEGTVEALALRVTRLRGEDGTVWYVRNGEILRVGNRSQQLAPPPPET
jgi:small conductance mechanosensitive channel